MIQNKRKKTTKNTRMRKAMMTLDIPLPSGVYKKSIPYLFLTQDELFQHFSDPLQFFLKGDQKLMGFSV